MTSAWSDGKFRLSRLTDSDLSNIREILTQFEEMRGRDIDDVMFSLESACGSAFHLERFGDPRQIREEITKFHDSISHALGRAESLSLYGHLELQDGYSEDRTEEDPDIDVFQGSGVSGEGIWGLRIRLRAAKKLAQMALERVQVHRGAPVNFEARALALEIREAFEDHKIKITSYDDGIFMRVLETSFASLLPGTGTESHRRHGKWALSVKDPDNDIDWYTMKIDLTD